jgi:glycosyltransferase involved in cell wall biosynthesis
MNEISEINFNSDWYLKSYPDVAASGMPALLHYQKFGKAEGRLSCANAAYDLELSLWCGDYSAISELNQIITKNDNDYNVAYAHWALARWHASAGEWLKAYEYIDFIIRDFTQSGLPQNTGPILLVFSILCSCKQFERASRLLDVSTAMLKNSSDYYLASCSVKQGLGVESASVLNPLAKMYLENNMLPLTSSATRASLDYLEAEINIKPISGPLVSVLVPVFNSQNTLVTAIKSLQAQTWKNLEIIIVDDASEDDSFLVAKQIAQQDSRIKVIQQHVNQGTYIARNSALKHASGKYITVHDADDYSHCQKIQLQVEVLERNAKLKASVSHWARCSTALEFGTWRQNDSWIYRNVSSLMFRDDVFQDLGYWDNVSINADTEYYYRILTAFGDASIAEVYPGVPLAFGRTGANNLTQSASTHLRTQFSGVRKDYMDAAREWHRSTDKSDLYMDYNPSVRSFNAPYLMNRVVCTFKKTGIPYFPGEQCINDGQGAILLCAHTAGETLYGAERSFIDMAKAINTGKEKIGGRGLIIAVPEQPGSFYMEELLKYCFALVVVPFKWWKGTQPDSNYIISQLESIIQECNVQLVAVNTMVLSAPHIAAKNQGVSSIMHIRELPDFDPSLCEILQANPEFIKEKIMGLASGYVANSFCTSSYVSNPKCSDVLYNVVDDNDFDLPLPVHDGGEVTFALISSNTPKKGVETFVRLAILAKEEVPLARFILVGPITECVESLMDEMPDNLKVCGYEQTPQKALKDAQVVMNLSEFQESFGRTVAEAMISLRPVIAYRWGAMPELIDNGVNGYLVHYNDIDGLLLRVKDLTENDSVRLEFGLAARDKMLSYFNFNTYEEKLNKIYGKFLKMNVREVQ